MAYAVGHISGGHFNPAITIGLATGRRFDWREVPAYVVTQIVGAIVAAAVLLRDREAARAGSTPSESGFATNGYGDRSPGGYSLLAVIVIEVVLTAFFLYVIFGVTDTRAPKGFAPLAIGLVADPDPPDLDPGQQHLGQPGPVDRAGRVRRRRRPLAALGVPGRADRRRDSSPERRTPCCSVALPRRRRLWKRPRRADSSRRTAACKSGARALIHARRVNKTPEHWSPS